MEIIPDILSLGSPPPGDLSLYFDFPTSECTRFLYNMVLFPQYNAFT